MIKRPTEMKAYLKAPDGNIFNLSPKVTTIGREACDLTIQVPGVDFQHAVIEYSEKDDCFIIQDLNTAQGTYVNDVRVQNAAVRLAAGDCVRFGYNGIPYELQVEQTSMVTCPPVQQRQVWTGPLTILNETPIYSNAHSQNTLQALQQQMYQQAQRPPIPAQGFPFLSPHSVVQPQPSLGVWTQPSTQAPVPRPPLRSRPLSAGATRRSTFDFPRFQGVSAVGSPVTRQGPVGGWVNGGIGTGKAPPPLTSSPGLDLTQQAQEKEYRINQLTEEVTRLRNFEFDSFRKDQLIQQLQQQISDLQEKLQQEPSIIMGSGDPELSLRLAQMEDEINAKRAEIMALKDQLNSTPPESTGNPLILRQELGERMKEVASLRSELERVKKDKNITSGLVTQMQHDMSNKDCTISKLTREIEVLRKDLRERDQLLSNANIKVNKIREASISGKAAEERDAREKELISLRQRFKSAENKISDQFNTITALRDELEKLKQSLFEEKDARRQIQAQADANKSQFLDMQRAERVVRIDLEQLQKEFERFRGKVIQTTFSTPGVEAPEKQITDDELIEILKKLLQERTHLWDHIEKLKKEVKQANSSTDELKAQGMKLRDDLQESLDRLKESGFLSSSLRQEASVVQSLSADDSLLWVRDIVHSILTTDLGWAQAVEAALEKCGVNIKLSSEPPNTHIELLYAKWESALSEKERLTVQIQEMKAHHQEELKVRLEGLQKEMESKLLDAVEKARLEGDEKVNRAIDDIRTAEAEKLGNAVADERQRADRLEVTVQQLRQSLMQRQEEDQVKLEQASELVTEVEQYKIVEADLKNQLVKLEERMKAEISQLQEEKGELVKKNADDLESYKEQVRQHSVTICAMEERLSKLNKKSKIFQEEAAALKKSNTGRTELDKRFIQKPVVPPKPKVILQRPVEEINALEHMLAMLRQENAELKKSVSEQQDVIMGLRRDLSGASARLSDITGEMSESQKREMEQNRELLVRRESELLEQRQQMAKLSKIIDKQKGEIKQLEQELSNEKSQIMKYRTDLAEQGSRLQDVEVKLKEEQLEQKKQLELLDQEGRITSELVGLGAQCRGERHEQIITRQREALAELRTRVKTLEQTRPPLPTQDQALQQVVMLKRELAEMRANQALAEDRVIASSTSLDREVGRTRGLISALNPEADMERSAHRETMDTLESSETTFLTLLRAVASALELEEVQGLRSMAHMPKDERDRLVAEREAACELLANRVHVLKERIIRKDELLQGYEHDLAKLREAQDFAERKTTQIDSLREDMKSKAEESHYLRESLSRTRDRLNQEKRLNGAIKQKKTFHLENERAHLQIPHSVRKMQEQQETAALRKKAQKELMKRKNYEIQTLKEELCDKEQALYDREKRLMSLERGLGLERAVEVID
ncbi:forkhead-associated domain-containing protein 1-like [Pomacea canaliculata]|uniref:forkhead-associated domain-containing protein 1-like n=1 Tax=Pomacea canaliculata TaxID=400727 RepID=UPI000D72B6A4|nr:forkhead-associated domain-containing protein 1-like [Pomacea canaliculata]